MNSVSLPDDCAKQWEILLLLLCSEEKKIDRTNDNEIDTMNYFYKNEGVRRILLQWLEQMRQTYAKKKNDSDTALKCDEVSFIWRQRGNDKFRSNQVEDSYRCYTRSVLYAKQDGPMYPLALANRSAALLRMKKFQECLSDIDLAVSTGYPEEQRHKLLIRRADCHIELGQRLLALTALGDATRHAASLKLSASHVADFDRHVKILEKKIDTMRDTDSTVNEVVLPECYLGYNEKFSAASNAIELRRSDSSGRYVVTRQSTKRGDVLFSEEPYACVTLPYDVDAPVCDGCCRSDINAVPCNSHGHPISLWAAQQSSIELPTACALAVYQLNHPGVTTAICQGLGNLWASDDPDGSASMSLISYRSCKVCSRSVYCGVECRSHGWDNFHIWECVGVQCDLFPTIGIAHLALRVLLVTASAGFPPVPSAEPDPCTASDLFNAYSKVDNINIYKRDSPPFYRMFNLVTNFEKMNNSDYIQYALTATMLTIYLENFTKFFELLPSKIPYALNGGQLRVFAAAVMLKSLGQLVCNGHAALSLATVEENDGNNGRTITEREVRRATAIYPSAAMMNHSCDPNIINTFYNSRLIIKCSRELPTGAEVLNCYGPHRAREPTVHRRMQLRAQYMFTCNCTACCTSDKRDFVLLFTAYSCQSCKGPVVWSGQRGRCPQCKTDLQLERALATIDRADELMVQAERATSAEERCERAQAALRLKQQVWHRHHTSLRASADRLARIYADVGEFGKSVELIKQNIQSLEYQFGSFSVEVAHELRKLSDVMLERIINSPQNPDYRDWCLEAHKIIKKAVQLMELNYGSWEPLVKRLKEQEGLVASLLADSRAPHSDSVHHNLHYNLKI